MERHAGITLIFVPQKWSLVCEGWKGVGVMWVG